MGRRTIIVVIGTAIAAAFWIWSLVEFSTHRVYKQPSESMQPTIGVNDRVLADENAYDAADPQINDIVVFHPPQGAETGGQGECGDPSTGAGGSSGSACAQPTPEKADVKFIKRIVALPGDTLSIQDGRPVVNGQLAAENFIEPCRPGGACNLPTQITIPPDHFFVLGDNRGASEDSRFWGPVPGDYLLGKVTDIGGLRSLTRIPPVIALVLLITFIAARVVAGMKRRWVFFGIGFFLFPVAVCGALMEARPGSYWARRWGSPVPT